MSKQNHLLHWHISKKKKLTFIDKTAVVLAFAYPITGLPQVFAVFTQGTEGVSLISWLGFMVFSLFFLAYALVHKIKPMIISNSLWFVVDTLVVGAVLISKIPTLS